MAHTTTVAQALTSHLLVMSSVPDHTISLQTVILRLLGPSLSLQPLLPRTTLNHSTCISTQLFSHHQPGKPIVKHIPSWPGHPAVNCWWMSSIKFLKTIQILPTGQPSCSLVRTSLANLTEKENITTCHQSSRRGFPVFPSHTSNDRGNSPHKKKRISAICCCCFRQDRRR